jgi:hypothetical protein
VTTLIPYDVIPLIASILLGAHYVLLGEASRRSQVAVAVTVGTALLIWWHFPRWHPAHVAATLLQVAVSIYVLVYLRLNRDGG